VRTFAFQVRAAGDDGSIEGYGSVFGVRDSYDDVIAPGAFAGSLASHKAAQTMPALLWQHKTDEPIGVWTKAAEDARGLMLTGRLALDTVRGKEAHSLVRMGAINGLSIGFVTKGWDVNGDVRTVTEIDLWEVSLVTFPANTHARVTGIKSHDGLQMPKDAERILREAGFSKTDATAFVSRVMRMGEERRDAAASAAALLTAANRMLQTLNH
jgi:HK97 family phage prohead protease